MSLKISFFKGLPHRIMFNQQVVGDDWGIETADYDSFFTLTENAVGCKVLEDTVCEFNQHATRYLEVEMRHGHWTLEIRSQYRANEFVVQSQLKTLKPSYFQDFVHRFRFHHQKFTIAQIAGQTLQHSRTNRWYQYPTSQVRLSGLPIQANIAVVSSRFPEQKFTQQMYVRDEPSDYWIVHSRLIPLLEENLWLRWYTRWGKWVDIRGKTAQLLLSFGPFRTFSWYRAERLGGHPNFQAQPLAKLQPGETIVMQTRVQFMMAENE